MREIKISKYGNCPSNFRIQKRDDILKIGFSDKQMESRNFVKRMQKFGKKTGLFDNKDGFYVLHWKLPNNGYPKNFKNYKTYERHWWQGEN